MFEAVRDECSKAVWSRAVQLSRSGKLDGRRTHNDEIEVRIATRGGMVSPLVVLSPEHEDWSCECNSSEPACIHVAAAVIALRQAEKEGQSLGSLTENAAKLVYRLERKDGRLHLERLVARGDKLTPLQTRLTALQREGRGDEIATSQADIAVDLALGSLVNGVIPRPGMQRVLEGLADCHHVVLDGKPIRVGERVPVVHIRVEDHDDGFLLRAEQDPSITEVFANGAVLRGQTLHPIGEADLGERDLEQLRRGRVVPFGQTADLVGRMLPALRERVPVNVKSKVLPEATPMTPHLVVQTDFDGERLTVLPTLVYGDPPSARVDGGKLHYLGGPLPLRNERREQRLRDLLRDELGMQAGQARRVQGYEALEIAEELRRWRGGRVQGDGLKACFVSNPLQPHVQLDGRRLDIRFESAGEDTDDATSQVRHASPEAVLQAWRRGESLVPLNEGGWAPLPEGWLQEHGQLVADLLAARGEKEELPASAAPDVLQLCEALDHPPPQDFTRLRALVEGFEGIPRPELPGDLQAALRDYQQQGVAWLSFLSQAQLGGLLADDMGLGKTVQTLCVVGTPTLVVCPASVLHNWAQEIERFRPALRTKIYHGPTRSLDDEADITLTTYALLRLDADQLAARTWDTAVLDEAQAIKNADSQVAQAAFRLDARFRVALSGTPVENRLEELWSQMRFLNPGLLGSRRDFQDRYARPIADGDRTAAHRLRRRIKPFVLRRLKKEVARELPARTDVVLRCELSDRERQLYESVHAAARKDVVDKLQAGGGVMAALEALLRLRQACCHPGLLPGQQADTSAKISLLLETLGSTVAEGHKALVFSQWTSLLDRIEPHLDAARIDFCRLDGATRDRKAVVDRFQREDGPPLMLVSLKAGGTGLNLTAADHVFLMDPWWNPAVEDQAADRAHRIGQDRPVLVHRLVAVDTVEERLLALQEHKRSLAKVATEGADATSNLTRDDLLELLQ